MGLNFSHSDAQWSYSGFARFRERLAQEIGLELKKMQGFGGTKLWSDVTDPLRWLLDHSDCDGEITARRCGLIAPRLREVVSRWPADDYDRQTALDLAFGMCEAAVRGEPLQFR